MPEVPGRGPAPLALHEQPFRLWGDGRHLGNGETALPGDPPGEIEVVEGVPDGGRIPDLNGLASAFTPEYAPEEMFEIAQSSTPPRADPAVALPGTDLTAVVSSPDVNAKGWLCRYSGAGSS